MSNIACDHCHLEFESSVMIEDSGKHFCCRGCQGVFHLLQDEGLENFYDKVGDTKLAPPVEQFEDASNFDSPAFYERFVKTNDEGFQEVSLIIEGIHCAACVWLNEKALSKMEGVVTVHINYTNNKAHIEWADHRVKLSAIIDMIRAIGYNAFPYDPSLQEVRANKERKDYYLRMAVAAFGTMNIMWIAVAQYAGYFTGIAQEYKTIMNLAEWALATPVLFYSGWVFFRGAWFGLRNRVVNMDILVATGATLTYIYSIFITLFEAGEAYFDSVSMIITFVLLGKFLEVLSKKSAADTLDVIGKHVPNEVMVLEGETSRMMNVNDVKVGDVILLKAGEKSAIDGEIIEGEGAFDESSLTGESEPIYKQVGDIIISGTTSIEAVVKYQATKDFSHSTLSNLVALLESAVRKKPHIEQLANRLSESFSAIILFLAFATFVAWWLWPNDFAMAFMIGISVIIIACPCALALATPVATLVGLGLGAKRGILFKEAAQLETMAKADVLVLDKTGTITHGRPEVVHATWHDKADLNLFYTLVQASRHPVSQGVGAYLMDEHEALQCLILDEVHQIAAKGMVGRYGGHRLLGGSGALMQDHGINVDAQSEYTLFYFAVDDRLVATLELSDRPKAGAKETLFALKHAGLDVMMLTGDHERSAARIAEEVGIDLYAANLSPDEKAQRIASMQEEGHVVVMAGDGVNDILALANADIGIAMGNGSDIAIDVSDVVLLNDSLPSLLEAFQISRTTFRLVKQNLGISLLYNGVTIPLAMGGYVIPLIAAISMSFSSLLVVGNSLRIQVSWKKKQ